MISSETKTAPSSKMTWREAWGILPKSSLMIFMIFSVAVAVLWYCALFTNRQQHETSALSSLTAIAELKSWEVALWRRQYLDYGKSLMNNPTMGAWLEAVIKSGESDELRQKADRWLREVIKDYDFQSVVLLDPQLHEVLAADEKHAKIGENARKGLKSSILNGAAELSDLHTAAQAPDVHLDLYVPVYAEGNGERVLAGLFLFRIDPRRTLFPMIRDWPALNTTGEAVLLSREGDEVVYLTPLRNCDRPPLTCRRKVTTPTVPVIEAMIGVRGSAEGCDRWGTPVIAVTRPVMGTKWWMMVKLDSAEIDKSLRGFERLMTITGVALINLAVLALGLSYYRQKRLFLLDRECAASERKALSEHYVHLAKYANDIILLVDEDKRVMEVNERAIRSYGYSKEAMLAMTIDALWSAGHKGEYQQAIQRLEREHTVIVETTHCRADGSQFPVEVSLRMIQVAGVKWFQAVVRDITERIQRRHFFDRYQALFMNARDIIMFLNKDGAIIDANQAAERAYEYTHAELTRMTVYDLRPSHTRSGIRDQIAQALAKGILFETEHRAKSGRCFPVEVSSMSIRVGEETYLLSIIRDITQRKAAEEAVVISEWNLRQMIDMIPQAIYARDAKGQFILANRRFADLAGKKQEDLLAGAPSGLAELSDADDQKVLKTGAALYIPEMMWTGPDGMVHVMQVEKVLFIPAGTGFPTVLSVATDITESKRLHEQLLHAQRMESVGRLAGGIAHDFNNLLQAILGFNEILLERLEETHPGRQDAMEIAKAAKRAGALTKQLMAYSRKQIMDLQVRSINAIVEGAAGFLQRLMGEAIQVVIRLDPDINPARVDVHQIEQVLMNLIVNARDAMAGEGRITISTSVARLTNEDALLFPEATPGVFTCLSVGDTGSGIKPGDMPHIFEPFFTTKGFGNGTGLGLSMVYGIVKQHGGWITVYSQPAMGTTFRIYFPAVDQSAENDVPKEESILVPPELNNARILVVEDEEGVRRFAVTVLKDHGFRIMAAQTVAEALSIYEKQGGAFDLVFTDVVLPDGNGVELARKIRKLTPTMNLLFTSGYMDIHERWPEIRDQRLLFLQKPYPILKLIETVVAALRNSAVKEGSPL